MNRADGAHHSSAGAVNYGDWMARHERSHHGHMARILKELA